MTEYLNTVEAGAVIRMSPDYIARQCKAKALAATKVGKEWRISRESLDAFMSRGQAPATRVRRRRAS